MRFLAILLACLTFCTDVVGHPIPQHTALRLKDRQPVTFAAMVNEFRSARLVVMGEDHDVAWHHELQLEVIKALHRKGGQLAIGLEMFNYERQRDLDNWVAGRISERQFRAIFAREWRMPWKLYRPIFRYARRHRIPLVGLNMPTQLTQKVDREGFSALTRAERQRLPPGISCNLTPTYRGFVRRVFHLHSTAGRDFERFCEAQVIWNKGMAWRIAAYLAQQPQRTLLVLAGSGHVVKPAIPAELSGFTNIPAVVLMPQSPFLAPERVTYADLDYLLLVN